MRSHLLKLSLPFLLFGFCGCQLLQKKPETPNPPAAEVTSNKTPDLQTRNNALALLDDLLNDEKNLSKVLLIKHHSEQLGKLVKEISRTAALGANNLALMAKEDSGINLKEIALPPGEVAAREAISKLKEHTLLHSANAEFEFQLLLTQSDALNYGAQLARVAALNESAADRVRELSDLSAQLSSLHEQVIGMLRHGS